MTPDWFARLAALARRRPVEITVVLVSLAALGSWIHAGVRNALVDLAASNLRSLVAADVVAVETWITEKRLNVQRWASDPRVVEAAGVLVTAAARGEVALRAACEGGAGARLIAAVDTLRREDSAAAIHLIGRDGRVLAARNPAKCGLLIEDAPRAAYAPVIAGQTRFAATQSDRERMGFATPAAGPRVWLATPVRDTRGEVIAALDIGKPAEERFSRLFAAAHIGETGETYAFDERGLLLSESRFRSALQDSGALRYGETGILRMPIADPEHGARVTALVAEALAARRATPPRESGERLQPYTTYHGERVVGAWRWLPAYGFGVAVEVSESEVFAPLARVEQAFAALGALLGLAGFGLLVALLRMEKLRLQRDEARSEREAQRVGNYELLEQVGQGGMARVYRARHRLLKRPTAVKIIELAIANDEALARFAREVRLASQLVHPNTVEVFDYGRTPEGQPFYAMEFLEGLTLQQVVERDGPQPAGRVAHVLRGIAGSLAEAHERGLVHRDVKPPNVMLCQRGGADDVVKVLDFGLVKDTRGEQTRDLTSALRVLGTPSYMAPERIEHPEGADFRSDLYALGAVGYYLLAGRSPFEAGTDLALAYQVVNLPPPPLPPTVPAPLATLVLRCLAKSPLARPQTAVEIIELLDAQLHETPWTAADARAWWTQQAQRGEASADDSPDAPPSRPTRTAA